MLSARSWRAAGDSGWSSTIASASETRVSISPGVSLAEASASAAPVRPLRTIRTRAENQRPASVAIHAADSSAWSRSRRVTTLGSRRIHRPPGLLRPCRDRRYADQLNPPEDHVLQTRGAGHLGERVLDGDVELRGVGASDGIARGAGGGGFE